MDAPLLCLESTVAVEELEHVWFIVDVILPESGPSPASREQHPDASVALTKNGGPPDVALVKTCLTSCCVGIGK